jgi:hypothetical protein
MADTNLPPNSPLPPSNERAQLEMEYLRAENAKLSVERDKLALELDRLKAPPHWASRLKQYLPLISTLLAVAGFWFGIWQYVEGEKARSAEQATAEQARLAQQRQAEQERFAQQKRADEAVRVALTRERTRPLWERRLALYIEATEKAAVIATTDDEAARQDAERRFWVLYWGPLAAVEDVDLGKENPGPIEAAMVAFGDDLKKDAPQRDRAQLKRLSLELAHRVREAMRRGFEDPGTESGALAQPNPQR